MCAYEYIEHIYTYIYIYIYIYMGGVLCVCMCILYNVRVVVDNVVYCDIIVSSNSSGACAYTFGLIPLGKA